MKRLLSILLIALIPTCIFAEPGDEIKTPDKDKFEICDAISKKMKAEFNAETSKDFNGRNVYCVFEYSGDSYDVSYVVKFNVSDGAYFYMIEYTVNSQVDMYDYSKSDEMYKSIREDISHIQSIVENIF